MGWFEGIVSMDGRLEGKERSDRRLLFIVAVAVFTMVSFSAAMTTSADATSVIIGSYTLVLVSMASIILKCVCRIYITKCMLQVHTIMWTISICCGHLHKQAISEPPTWSWFVAVLDLVLVVRLGRSFAMYLMGFMVFWVLLLSSDLQFRFGLLDLPGSAPLSRRLEKMSVTCDCSNPPCTGPAVWKYVEVFLVSMVLIVDFFATRGFAEQAEKEQAAMARTIETVEAAAHLLADYDIDTVADLLEAAEGHLPPAMHAALWNLEQNLRSYRPYLPVALFERVPGDDDGRGRLMIAPGADDAEATLVFTDIRASTSVWEAAPEAMQKAVNIHNAVIRKVVAQFGGYEVKTIGDSFMVAFKEPCAGMSFGLGVHEALLAAEWPSALLEVPMCRRTELWGGLTVRVGVNHGPVVSELNTLTGRMDYFGHTVNVASRLESTCVPGAVAVPSAVWAQVSSACPPAMAGPDQMMNLKGLLEVTPVRHVWPASLADRCCNQLTGRATSPRNSFTSHGSKYSDLSESYLSVSRQPIFKMQEKGATIGVLSIDNAVESAIHSSFVISDCLEAIVPVLQQNRGTLVSLLGEHLFVGWNLVQPVAVHAENAVQFVRRILRVPLGRRLTVGMAGGRVCHGDVGTRNQRFVTVAGPGVAAALLVWRRACDTGRRFLYDPGEDKALVGALRDVLQTSLVEGPLWDLYELSLNEAEISKESMN